MEKSSDFLVRPATKAESDEAKPSLKTQAAGRITGQPMQFMSLITPKVR